AVDDGGRHRAGRGLGHGGQCTRSAARARAAPHHGPLRQGVEVVAAGAGPGDAARGHVGPAGAMPSASAHSAALAASPVRAPGPEVLVLVVAVLLTGSGDEEYAEGRGLLGEQLEPAAVVLDQGPRERQADAGAARAAPRDGALEDLCSELRVDPAALVGDLDDGRVVVAAHLDRGAAVAVGEGVLDEGRDDL